MMLAVAVWTSSTGLGMLAQSTAANFIWLTIRMTAVVSVPVFWFVFAARYAEREAWLNRPRYLLLTIVPAISLLLMATSLWHDVFLVSIQYIRSGPFLIDAVWELGPWFWVHFIYSYLLILSGDILILQKGLDLFSTLRYQALLLLLGTIFPILTNVNYVFHLLPQISVNYDSLGFFLSGVAFFLALYGFRLFDLRPIARQLLVDGMSDAMLVFDVRSRLVDSNPSARRLFALVSERAIGNSADHIFAMQPFLKGMLTIDQADRAEIQMERDGEIEYFDVRLSPLFERGNLVGRMLVLRNITEARLLQQSLEEMAITDPLTGLFNRRQFEILGRQELERTRRYGRPFSVMIFDLDTFKQINDAYGHQVGDEVLKVVALLLRNTMRRSDMCFRYGGEEFTALMPATGVEEARKAAERLRRAIAISTVEWEETQIHFTISIGLSIYTGDENEDFDLLVARADRAMYVAKRAGRNRVSVAEN